MLEIFENKPQDFSPQVEVAACYLEIDGKILLLLRSLASTHPGTWGVPAGKLEKGESPESAAKRELFEETGIAVEDAQIQYLKSLYLRKPEISYVYHMFKVALPKTPDVRLSAEHQDYTWAAFNALSEMPLIEGAYQALEHYKYHAQTP